MSNHLRSQWEANAEAYTKLLNGKGTPHHQHILNPCIERLMGDVRDLHLLDAGCGEGYLSRYYAQKGATVVGVDFSPTLIKISKQKSQGFEIEYQEADICQLKNLADERFDIVLSNLVLLNVECLNESLSEFYRVLRPKGFLVFSIVHPAFNIYGPGRWELGEKDEQSGRRIGRFFVVDNYFNEKEFRIQWKSRSTKEFPMKFSFFHRTLSTYVNSVVHAGFSLVAVEEPRPLGKDEFFAREHRIPFFLVIKAKKNCVD